ncbi:MAG: hypothetical protein N2C12_03795, partial [Planctomycetales bacterium]
GPLNPQAEMWAKPEYEGYPNVDVTGATVPSNVSLPAPLVPLDRQPGSSRPAADRNRYQRQR